MIRTCATALLLTLASCSGGDTDEPTAAPVALVSLAPVTSGNFAETVTLYGAVESGTEAQYTLAAPVEAVVVSIPAPAGSAVGRGQLVALLRPTPTTKADLTAAASEARTAQAALARALRLRTDGLASDADVESARTAAESAAARSASLASLTRELALRSPGAGHVQSVVANPGEIVAAGTTVATISHGGTLRARFGVDPATARRLAPGITLAIAPAGGGESISVPIASLDTMVDPQTRLASAYVSIPASAALGPGQPLTATVAVAHSGAALTVPYSALLDDGGQPFVYVARDGVAHRRDVTLGPTSGDRIAITSGVAAGDLVVTQGGTAVEDGMKVRTE